MDIYNKGKVVKRGTVAIACLTTTQPWLVLDIRLRPEPQNCLITNRLIKFGQASLHAINELFWFFFLLVFVFKTSYGNNMN